LCRRAAADEISEADQQFPRKLLYAEQVVFAVESLSGVAPGVLGWVSNHGRCRRQILKLADCFVDLIESQRFYRSGVAQTRRVQHAAERAVGVIRRYAQRTEW